MYSIYVGKSYDMDTIQIKQEYVVGGGHSHSCMFARAVSPPRLWDEALKELTHLFPRTYLAVHQA